MRTCYICTNQERCTRLWCCYSLEAVFFRQRFLSHYTTGARLNQIKLFLPNFFLNKLTITVEMIIFFHLFLETQYHNLLLNLCNQCSLRNFFHMLFKKPCTVFQFLETWQFLRYAFCLVPKKVLLITFISLNILFLRTGGQLCYSIFFWTKLSFGKEVDTLKPFCNWNLIESRNAQIYQDLHKLHLHTWRIIIQPYKKLEQSKLELCKGITETL